jgi:hypothetical protein
MNTAKTRFMDVLCRAAFPAMRVLVAGLVVSALSATASATVVSLSSNNSIANFSTEPTDATVNTRGLYQWTVNGTDHLAQQWFWYRVGTGGGEASIDTLVQQQATPMNLDGQPGDDFLRVRYRNPGNTFEINVDYVLTGGQFPAGNSHLDEIVSIRNLSNAPLDFHFFQYVDFDLNGTPADDTVAITGTPPNTAVQTDGVFELAETVVTPPPSHFEVAQVGSATDLLTRLNDGGATTLADLLGPLVNADASWAFQWDMAIPANGSFQISKNKALSGPAVPEPGTLALAACGLGSMLVWRRRRAG